MASPSPPELSNQQDPSMDTEIDASDIDPAMLAAMGFASFGMQTKPSSYIGKSNKSNPLTIFAGSTPTGAGAGTGADGDSTRGTKRQKPNPVPDRGRRGGGGNGSGQRSRFASGANGTPVSIRGAMFGTAPQRVSTATVSGSNVQTTTGEESINDDPGYEDSDAEPEPDDDGLVGAMQSSNTNALPSTNGNGSQVMDAQSGERQQDVQYDEKNPPASRRLPNGDWAFFLRGFIDDDPWRGLVAKPLPVRERR